VGESRAFWMSPEELLSGLQLGDLLIGLFPEGCPPGWAWVPNAPGYASCIFTGDVCLVPEPTQLFRARPKGDAP